VPTLVLDDGRVLTESLLILMWLENRYTANSLLGGDPSAVLSKVGIAMGGVDAAAAIIIGRKMTDGAVLLDYVRFRLASAAWLPKIPHLDALSLRLRSRLSFEQTLPRDEACDNIVKELGIQTGIFSPEHAEQFRYHFKAGWVGTPEMMVDRLGLLSEAGMDGVCLSWLDYNSGIKKWNAEVMPLLEKAGLRQARSTAKA
jgi:hypothetical protein